MLEYKASWYGKTILKIGRFESSSKLCSNCGYKPKSMGLHIRSWTCPDCGTVHDRDVNAAINIKNIALGIDTGANRSGGSVDLCSMEQGMKQKLYTQAGLGRFILSSVT